MDALLWERVALAVAAVMRARQVVAGVALSCVVMWARQGLATVVVVGRQRVACMLAVVVDRQAGKGVGVAVE